ncbi:MAG TPA: hypothetical protein VG675_25455 [Bryobacteraceae bacterium]|nr:hypothetical protein [Bryobacteraceae bacterium]
MWTSSAGHSGVLFEDDFSHFPAGWLTQPVGSLNAAIQEYHYLPNRGIPLGPWANAITHLDAWVVSDENGKAYLEQQFDPSAMHFTTPIFVTGDPEWADYTVEARIKPLSTADIAGVVFRYHTNRHYYIFAMTGGNRVVLMLHMPLDKGFRVFDWRTLGEAKFAYDTQHYYSVKVENSGSRIRAYVDSKLLLQVDNSEILRGKAGVASNIPARFEDFRVSASAEVEAEIGRRIAARDTELNKLRENNPKPKLWKKFQTPGFGAGRNVRFGDLDGDGKIDMLIAQNIPRVRADAFDAISCLTAVTLDGKVIWQIGRPDPRNGLLTNDTPFQIHDVDGDGKNEVVMVKDFQLQILDGATGKVKRSVWMPKAPEAKEHPYDLVNGDSIAFLNLSGNKARHEILVKDRYRNFWIFNNHGDLLWHGEGQTGHYPFPWDINDDGRDEFMIGYSLWEHAGHQLWSRDKDIKDHADGVVIANLSPDPTAAPRVYASGSDEGFIMFDIHGNILKHVRVGHNQSPSVGKYRMDVPGLQYISINFWRNPGIVTLFDWDGNILAQEELIHSGSPMLPVNWRGDGQEFVLLSGNSVEGGMIDGHLRRVVMFPNDGHPELAANVLNLTGDARDEIVLWDQNQVWIYTQDRPFRGRRLYDPKCNPNYNESNYRTNVCLSGWQEVHEPPGTAGQSR